MKFEILVERMSAKAKKEQKKYLKTPKAKKAKRLKARCELKHKDKINKTKGKSHHRYCSNDGKLSISDKTKQDLVKMAKRRKRNKNKIIK